MCNDHPVPTTSLYMTGRSDFAGYLSAHAEHEHADKDVRRQAPRSSPVGYAACPYC